MNLFDWCNKHTENNLLTEWDFEKNTEITPFAITRMSTRKVWWKCSVCGNEYKCSPHDKRKTGTCKKCKGNKYVNIGKNGLYCVYIHTSPDGKRYVGTTNMPVMLRWGNGNNYRGRFGKAILEIGWNNFKHEVVATDLTREEAEEKEKELIRIYNTTDERYGFNMTDGGFGGTYRNQIFSEERRRNISEALMGKKLSEEHKKKLSIAHKGLKGNHTCAVLQLDKNMNILNVFRSMKEAEDCTGVNSKNIQRVCSGKRRSSGGYIWKYKDM